VIIVAHKDNDMIDMVVLCSSLEGTGDNQNEGGQKEGGKQTGIKRNKE
jgi:hypothetical protein